MVKEAVLQVSMGASLNGPCLIGFRVIRFDNSDWRAGACVCGD